ncbi:MAG: phosphoribosylformylglycinamidine synthase subunit PurL, partial [Planctomycetes bacterium]|nr:phosphoribosylformylglycinamidine synthase subunit PurL [Planctomycetota bacterium]
VVWGPLRLESLTVGSEYQFELVTVPIRQMSDEELMELSQTGQLYLSLVEMKTIQAYFAEQGRDPTDVELESLAQTWSEHCSHKTLAGRIHYRDEQREIHFENMLKETIFAATQTIRARLGADDWCVSVFRDNAGVVRFDDKHDVCFKVETHNHPSALEPYGGANTGIGGVIRDPLGTGLGAKPICNTDVFCFAPPDFPFDRLPPGVLHPKAVMRGVVAGVRDYGNRMGIPTVNGAIYFDERYLGNPLVYCGNVAIIPVGKSQKRVEPGDLIVVIGGRTGRDGIHGATFSSAELTQESEQVSGGAVQIGNAITEKMVVDVVLAARDRGLYHAITDCGAGGFSSAVGEMGAECGAEVWLERAPLKYSGLSYTEIWISEAQERMVLAVPPQCWEEFRELCASEGVEAAVIGEFRETGRLVLKYHGHQVGDLSMHFLHKGRPAVVREAVYTPPEPQPLAAPSRDRFDEDLKRILGSLNVCSKHWVIRQYDHEVQGGSVVKPLVGTQEDGPSDAAVVRPDLSSPRGLVIACGMNPRYGDLDPYWMAASAVDEAVRNCVAVGADPRRIAILDNFCWGNTDRPETLGSLVRAALGCHDTAVAFGTPFISGKDSLNNEFSYVDEDGQRRQVAIPPSLLISALGQIADISQAVTMDLKEPGNTLYLIGTTRDELGGSHFALVNGLTGGTVPHVDFEQAPRLFAALFEAVQQGLVRSCHDLSEGGLAVAAAEMAFAGGLGADLDLASLADSSGLAIPVLLFSESNSRFLVEVNPERRAAFEALWEGLPCTLVGRVTDCGRLRISLASSVTIDAAVDELKCRWQEPLSWD